MGLLCPHQICRVRAIQLRELGAANAKSSPNNGGKMCRIINSTVAGRRILLTISACTLWFVEVAECLKLTSDQIRDDERSPSCGCAQV